MRLFSELRLPPAVGEFEDAVVSWTMETIY